MFNWLGKFLIGALTGLAAITLVCAALLFWRLSRGPVALDFLTPTLQHALNDNRLGVRVALGRTVLDWSDWSPSLPITARQVRLLDRTGRIVATVPRLAVRLGVPALLRGRVALTAIELIGPALGLVRHPDGSVTIAGVGPDEAAAADLWQMLRDALGGVAEPGGALADLHEVRARAADLSLTDQATGQVWRLDGARVDVDRNDDTLEATFDLPMAAGAARWRLSGAGSYVRSADRGEARIGLEGLDPSRLPAGLPAVDQARRVHMPVRGAFVVGFTGTGATSVHADLLVGPGTVAVPEQYPAPLRLDGLELRGDYAVAARLARIEVLRLRRDTFVAELHGRVDFGPDGWRPAVAVSGSGRDLRLDTLLALWPEGISAGGRHWVEQNMLAAHMPEGTFRIALPRGPWNDEAMPADAVQVSCRLDATDAHYMGQLPPLRAASGRLHLTWRELRVEVDQGSLDVPGNGRLAVHDGVVTIAPLHQVDKQIDVVAPIGGPARAVLGLLDLPPLGYTSEFGLSPSDVGGEVAGQAHFRLPTKKDLKLREVEFDGSFRLSDFRVARLIGGLPLTDGAIALHLDRQAISGQGTGRLAGSAARITWTQQLTRTARPTRFAVKTRLDEAARRALGIDLAPRLAGPIDLDARLEGAGAKIAAMAITADLAPATLALDTLRWRKPADEPANATAQIEQDGKQLVIRRATLRAAGLDIAGSGALGPDGKLDRLAFDRFVVAGTADLSGSVARVDGVWQAQAGGRALDVTEMLKTWLHGKDSKPLPPFQLKESRIAQLRVAEGAVLTDTSIAGSGDGKRIEQLALRGTIPAKGAMSLRLDPAGAGVRKLRIEAPDAGFVLAALNVTNKMRDGQLAVAADVLPAPAGQPATIKGRADIRDFRLQGAPALAKVLTLASLTGLRDTLLGQGVSFDRLEMPFEMRGDIVRLQDARAVGSQLGITAHGTLDRKADALDLEGTLAPIYTLNSLLGHVPVLGALVRGKEGLIALRYSAQGPVKDPKVSVNPLSVLTPGFLRGIFDLMKGPSEPEAQGVPSGGAVPAAP